MPIYSNDGSSSDGFIETGTGTTALTTVDGRTCWQIKGNATPGATAYSSNTKDIGEPPALFAVEATLKHVTLGTVAADNRFSLIARRGDVSMAVAFGTDGLFVNDGVSNVKVGSITVETGQWTWWAFLINATTAASATVDILKDGVVVATGVDCSLTGTFTNGNFSLTQYATTLGNTETLVDSFLIRRPYYLSGTIKERASVDTGEFDYAVIESLTDDLFAASTTVSRAFSVMVPSNTTLYDVVALDPAGTYGPKNIAERVTAIEAEA